jgi:hypothetical protein
MLTICPSQLRFRPCEHFACGRRCGDSQNPNPKPREAELPGPLHSAHYYVLVAVRSSQVPIKLITFFETKLLDYPARDNGR